MRELHVVNHESTPSSLVLRTEDGAEFFLDLTSLDESTAALLHPGQANLDSEQAAAAPAVEKEPAAENPAQAANNSAGATLAPVPGKASGPSTDVLTMRPPEIQNRIRAGASISELAQEMGVADTRVEPFAHPVLLERARMAELAKQAHPIREDGPAKLTIFEILATAFAARGHSLANASWDAYRVKGEPWTIKVSWKAGLSENEALWTLKQSSTSPDVLEARNTVAADLTDPDFVQPVRTLTSVSKSSTGAPSHNRRLEAIDSRQDHYQDDFSADEPHQSGSVTALGQQNEEPSSSSPSAETADGAAEAEGQGADEEFLQNPEPKPAPTKRRRKTVTPHWEDVLLGVRANTKRPRK